MDNILFLKPKPVQNKIRVGSKYDGGYIVYAPSLFKCDILLSYGIGWNVDFEEHFWALTHKQVHMFDPTMFTGGCISKQFCFFCLKTFRFRQVYKHISFRVKWKRKLQMLSFKGIFFHNEGISSKVQYKYNSLKNHIMQYKLSEKKILLKIDIEENEYPILADNSFYHCLQNVDQFLIEFHNLKNRLREIKNILSRLNEWYDIIHIHGVNDIPGFHLYNENGDLFVPDVLEITLVKKDSILPDDYLQDVNITYPCEGLDFPTRPDKPDLQEIKFEV